MRRRLAMRHPLRSVLTDETGHAITFATPGDPTPQERRRYAQAVHRARTPWPMTPEQQVARDAGMRRRREILQELGVYVDE